MTPWPQGVAEAARRVAEGQASSEELVAAALARIDELEPELHAWAHLDRDHAREQARAADAIRRRGRPVGPLHGVPIGVKDIFDTRDMPTENGTVLDAGRRPAADAFAVARLRAAGAVILGKTVTTELAVFTPGPTRNPRDPARTPGGSSSGSAAAVACGMVGAALGSQTNGSTIRPAAFCGVFGYKPSHGLIPRTRMLHQSRALDHVGLLARSVEDLALLGDALAGFDDDDPDTAPAAAPALARVAAESPPMTPRLAFVKTGVWDRAEADTRAGFAELVRHLGDRVVEETLPKPFDRALEHHRAIHEADIAVAFAALAKRGADRLSPRLMTMIERGRGVSAIAYNDALAAARSMTLWLADFFHDYDAIVTPAVAGQAPLGLESTGDPAFCTTWTLAGGPAVSLPLLSGADGLPIGVQLVGAKGDDARLLRTANWLVRMCRAEPRKPEP